MTGRPDAADPVATQHAADPVPGQHAADPVPAQHGGDPVLAQHGGDAVAARHGAGPVLAQLRAEFRQLTAEAEGPLRRVSIRSGDTALEVEWPGPAAVPAGAEPGSPTSAARPVADAGRRLVVSPMVGTFYRAPEPGAPPFVEVGDMIESGQVIGIVEAMKLMNRVTAEQAGKVSELLASDGEPVEFQQPLIALVSG